MSLKCNKRIVKPVVIASEFFYDAKGNMISCVVISYLQSANSKTETIGVFMDFEYCGRRNWQNDYASQEDAIAAMQSIVANSK